MIPFDMGGEEFARRNLFRMSAIAATMATAALAEAQTLVPVDGNGRAIPPAVSPNGKKRPKNGECPNCATQHVAISKPVTGCKQWVPGPNGGAVCPPDKVKLGKPAVPDNAIELPGGAFGIRCLHCSGVFIQDPE